MTDESATPDAPQDKPTSDAPANAGHDRADVRDTESSNWVLRIVLVLVALVAAFIAFRVAAAFFPRWWAQRVADQVQGGFTAGTLWGLFYGFLFTFVPLLILFQIRRRFFNWTWRLIVALFAIVLAAPNWLTLSVVLGTSKAAHAGERIMDVDAPNFRAGTLIGAVIGAAAALALTATSLWMTRRKNQVKRLKSERDQLRRSISQPPDESH
ncbi:hypothetical protein GCM10022234_10560 [Aeromicrobium panaciterrae]|uniref:hypothetical protein n=1 Tax=Aeromicrobium panaciterrae TaxID=363861 RepID=UPI0031DA21CA